ncbi:MAG TPA: 2-oxoacid:ferredoxin oxidoreductase subunit beta [Thermoflexales bacterium]|nr:2-oxoacid:ferredoxin oxidoreductase subunit beta [Thermoflexales bacterium]HQW35404.1 2-oxoacid:ferredoxin oxidoreductase subunit beta [Thermoflexales bacterium]HQZ21132.1 2-oxoacid:ferredoxin oxidoreductase subunit beta [Thermoflexales bacterium]HRA00646.1 2-oxoacid:ferredoxin oxidoreductase subunit beta [Thermoflexales bacterium]
MGHIPNINMPATMPGAKPGAPSPAAAAPKVNLIGLEKNEYRGNESTLCNGCGHDSISARIIDATYELGIRPEQTIKLSGIGCSSKSPAYWLNRSHGFNSLHGRMPSVATGALMANHLLNAIGVSGDGDTGSIGIGQFKHILRKNVRMVYIVENNGVYGLTKGQFSATTDKGQELKYAGHNDFMPIDLCLEAIASGCGFVARGFAGNAKQVTALIKAALNHNGTALLDIISPCVTFNNKDDSTKSYAWGREHDERVNDINFVAPYDEVQIEDFPAGVEKEVELHNGAKIVLAKTDHSHDPTDMFAAMRLLAEAREKQQFITGLIYVNPSAPNLSEVLNLGDVPLARLPAEKLRPSAESLAKLMAGMV